MTSEAGAGLPQPVETVLLDAGGVLLDLDYAYLRRLIDARGHAVTVEDLSASEVVARSAVHDHVRNGGRVGEAWRDYFRTILGRVGVPPGQHESLIDSLWEAHQRVGLWTVAIDGSIEAVRQLKQRGYRIGVVSNAEGRVERDLEGAGYRGLFETVVDSHVVGVEKPDPAIFALALERMQAEPGGAIYVGDVPAVDVEGARRAGLVPILIDRHDRFGEIDAIRLPALRGLPELLRRTGQR